MNVLIWYLESGVKLGLIFGPIYAMMYVQVFWSNRLIAFIVMFISMLLCWPGILWKMILSGGPHSFFLTNADHLNQHCQKK